MKPRNPYATDPIMRKSHVHKYDQPDEGEIYELLSDEECPQCGGSLLTDGFDRWCLDCGYEYE